MFGFNGLMYFPFMALLFGPVSWWQGSGSINITLVSVVIYWGLLWLMLKEKPIFFILFLILWWLNFGLVAIGLLINFAAANSSIDWFLIIQVTNSVLFIFYMHLSKRVNVTYRLRVRPEDLRLVWGSKRVDKYFTEKA